MAAPGADGRIATVASVAQFGDEYAALEQQGSRRLWAVLQSYLTKYDSVATQYRYHELVASRLLASGRSSGLPMWLVQFYSVRPAVVARTHPVGVAYLTRGFGPGRRRAVHPLPRQRRGQPSAPQPHDPSTLLRLYMRYGYLDEAVTLAGDYVTAVCTEPRAAGGPYRRGPYLTGWEVRRR